MFPAEFTERLLGINRGLCRNRADDVASEVKTLSQEIRQAVSYRKRGKSFGIDLNSRTFLMDQFHQLRRCGIRVVSKL